jgi:hypothetical protein
MAVFFGRLGIILHLTVLDSRLPQQEDRPV